MKLWRASGQAGKRGLRSQGVTLRRARVSGASSQSAARAAMTTAPT